MPREEPSEKVRLSIAVSLYNDILETLYMWSHSQASGEETGNEALCANITHKFVNFRNVSRVGTCGT